MHYPYIESFLDNKHYYDYYFIHPEYTSKLIVQKNNLRLCSWQWVIISAMIHLFWPILTLINFEKNVLVRNCLGSYKLAWLPIT